MRSPPNGICASFPAPTYRCICDFVVHNFARGLQVPPRREIAWKDYYSLVAINFLMCSLGPSCRRHSQRVQGKAGDHGNSQEQNVSRRKTSRTRKWNCATQTRILGRSSSTSFQTKELKLSVVSSFHAGCGNAKVGLSAQQERREELGG